MTLFTSSFHLRGRDPRAVSIANTSRWYNVARYLPLVPPWKLVRASRAGKIDPAEFDRLYLQQLRKLDPRRVIAELGDGAILLCWEEHPDDCHRRIVADWLLTELGIVVEELVTLPVTNCSDAEKWRDRC